MINDARGRYNRIFDICVRLCLVLLMKLPAIDGRRGRHGRCGAASTYRWP